MNEIDNIRNVIHRFANAFDTKDWAKLATCLADIIECDYSDLRNSNGSCSRGEYVEKRQKSLAPLITQHLFSNIEVIDLQKSHAQLQASAVIYRRNNAEVFFNTHAIYQFSLKKIDNHWVINEISQKVLWNEGDKRIHAGVSDNFS